MRPLLTSLATSDYSGTQTKLPKILLNGNNVCMVRDCPRLLSIAVQLT